MNNKNRNDDDDDEDDGPFVFVCNDSVSFAYICLK